MIGKLTGRLDTAGTDGLVCIDVAGVGYVVRLPAQAGTPLLKGVDISLFIHTAVREDAIDLYGFPTEEELAFFKQLMSVSGIGPKTALGIMSVGGAAALKQAIARGDAQVLTKVFGIGKKNAERLVVELRDKINVEASKRGELAAGGAHSSDVEVLEALMALGYRADEARAALSTQGGSASGGKDASGKDTRERLAAALKKLGTKQHA